MAEARASWWRLRITAEVEGSWQRLWDYGGDLGIVVEVGGLWLRLGNYSRGWGVMMEARGLWRRLGSQGKDKGQAAAPWLLTRGYHISRITAIAPSSTKAVPDNL